MHVSIRDLCDHLKSVPVFGPKDGHITSISTDSRTLRAGDCFVALRGASFDAHHFVPQAVAGGASALIVERPFLEYPHITQFVVQDTLYALGEIARLWRLQLQHIPLVVLTGSNGKTTVKEMTAQILATRYRVLATEGNLNNLVGVPLTLLRLEPTHEVAVIELGMNQRGELDRLVRIAMPDCVVITNITNAHVGMLGSVDALYEAKTESLRAAPPHCAFVLNADDALSQRALRDFSGGHPVVRFGSAAEADIRAEFIEPLAPFGYRFALAMRHRPSVSVELRMFGRHNILNAAAAVAVGEVLGTNPEAAAAVLRNFRPAPNRSEVEEINGVYVVKDYYNASPAAVEQALRSLAEFNVPGRRFAVLGDMMELGDAEEFYHAQVGQTAARMPLNKLFTIGRRARIIQHEAVRGGLASQHFDDVELLAHALQRELRPGDLLLIKASRLMKLEQLYDLLKGAKTA